MRVPVNLTVMAALLGFVGVLLAGRALLQPDMPLITKAGFDREAITPDADGDNDAAIFEYGLSRNAFVTITFESEEDGAVYTFRDRERRIRNDYSVIFSGVVDGYLFEDEAIPGEVERRLMPDGQYVWRIRAEAIDSDESQEVTGKLLVEDADSPLPIMSVFTVGPEVFTPNQDSIDDRAEINIFLEKEADLRVFLVGEGGDEIPISARKECRKPGESGRHCFDYEGGIDLGAEPPADGEYRVVALAQDDVGQRIRRQARLTILDGGKPRAEIVPQSVGVDVVFETRPYEARYFTTRDAPGDLVDMPNNPASLALTDLTVPLGDMLVFKLTVENYGGVPIRTTGPFPGTVYQQEQQAATLGWFEESGAWRVGIECDTSMKSFPYRWAVGAQDDLITEIDPVTGNEYFYLPAGARSVVWGAIRMTRVEDRNPQDCWAGLIHEDVEITLRNNNVGRRSVEIVDTHPDTGE